MLHANIPLLEPLVRREGFESVGTGISIQDTDFMIHIVTSNVKLIPIDYHEFILSLFKL